MLIFANVLCCSTRVKCSELISGLKASKMKKKKKIKRGWFRSFVLFDLNYYATPDYWMQREAHAHCSILFCFKIAGVEHSL